MSNPIRKLAEDVLEDPVRVQVGHEAPVHTVSHAFYPVAPHLKTALLLELLDQTPTESVLVFTRTKYRAKQLGGKLAKVGYRSTSLQGNLSQARRRDAMKGFRSGKYQILVATDIAARGIDVAHVSHVINYDMPSTPEAYIHRIGRTGRAECRGEAFTLLTGEDKQIARAINAVVGYTVERRILDDFNYKPPDPAAHSSRKRKGAQTSTVRWRGRKKKRPAAKGPFIDRIAVRP
jgi:superfamily II DNA/RNA helicase